MQTITKEWLYHLGVPVSQIDELAENSAICVPTMMPYITAFFHAENQRGPTGCYSGRLCWILLFWGSLPKPPEIPSLQRAFSQNCNGIGLWAAWR